jgi:hypothetical protein
MSTVQPTDKTLVNRAGVDHSAPADMSTVQDTDLLLINRAGVDYKCTFLDWKNSQSKAPDVGAVTLADVAGGSRFTSVSFPVSATMTENGIPASTKKLKAYVEGTLKSAAQTSGIASVAGNVLTLTDNTQLANFTAGDAITEVTSTGTAGDAFGTVGAVDAVAKTITLTSGTGIWDVGSAVKGPPKTLVVQFSQALASHASSTSLTFAPGTDMSSLAAGDAVVQKLTSGQSVVFYSDKGDISTDPNLGFAPGDAYSNYAQIFAAGSSPLFVISRPNAHLTFKFDPPLLVPTATSLATYLGDANARNPYNIKINGVNYGPYITEASLGAPQAVPFVGSISTLELVGGATGIAASKIEIGGVKVVGTAAPQGVVGSIAGTVVSLSASSGTWTVGQLVVGPAKVNSVKLYCKLDAAGAVSDLQSADPGFTAWTPAGTGPYTGTVTFPATLPSGAAPDTDLPAGTTITVEVEASNTSGSDSAKSNTVTPV